MRARLFVTGDKALMDELRALGDVYMVEAGKEVLENKSKEILALMRPMTPVEDVDGGHLVASERTTRPNYQKRSGRIVAGVTAGGRALAGFLEATHHHYNVFAVVQESGQEHTRSGRQVTLHHTSGQSHFMEAAAVRVAPSVPEALQEAIDRRANAGR